MNFKDRIGFDAGSIPLEDALQTAISHDFHYLDFNADDGVNRLGNWSSDRIASVRKLCKSHDIYLSLHTASSVNIAETSPFVDEAVDWYLRENIDLSRSASFSVVITHPPWVKVTAASGASLLQL